jgi:hypothetical protein
MASVINVRAIMSRIFKGFVFLLIPIVKRNSIKFVLNARKISSPTHKLRFVSLKTPIVPHFPTKTFACSVIYSFTTTSILRDASNFHKTAKVPVKEVNAGNVPWDSR